MTLSEELLERGLVYQFSTESLGEIFDTEKRVVYLGVDPTAPAMHVGHLVPYMLLNHLLRAGHRVILLIGGGTALIGDPSGKDAEREFVETGVVEERAQKLEEQIRKITEKDVVFVNNHEWLSKLTLVSFLRDVGKHFTVNAMVKKDAIATRLSSETGISFTEFSYALLQSYDFYHLHTEHKCDVQIGGSDQWGNISSGIDYIRRVAGNEVYGLTLPLLINPSSGKKFGKSEGNAVWLDAELTSPHQFYQFWLNTPDEQVISYLKIFTFQSLEEITELEKQMKAAPNERAAQKTLAKDVTAFVHGNEVAENIEAAARVLFSTDSMAALSKEDKDALLSNVPPYILTEDQELFSVLVATSLAKSNREAREFITEGAVSIEGEKITDVEYRLTVAAAQGGVLLKKGKRERVVIKSQ